MLRGWVACDGGRKPEIDLRTSEGSVQFTAQRRPDVAAVHRGMKTAGFWANIRLSDHLSAMSAGKLTVQVLTRGVVAAEINLSVRPRAVAQALQRGCG
jgi:hypothetical protein